MIMTKTPFRISFAGGGSDLADFYEQYGGCVLSTSINRYCYISIHPYFDESKTLLKYSENELVGDLSEIRHRIFNCVLNERKLHGVEIVSTADVPGGTGLGSSSTFTVGLINTLNCYQGKYMSKGEIAERACRVEIEKLGSPIGKQDQYAAAYGGLNFIRFHRDGTVNRYRGLISSPEQLELEPCAAEAIRLLNRSGYLAIVATNQPVVARGMCGMTDVEEIHRKLATLLGQEGAYLDGIVFCPHHPDKPPRRIPGWADRSGGESRLQDPLPLPQAGHRYAHRLRSGIQHRSIAVVDGGRHHRGYTDRPQRRHPYSPRPHG